MKFTLIITIFAWNCVNIAFAYGFDSGQATASCSQKVGRRGRAQLLATIPCDLSIQTYCNLPGSLYPWHAVRRFVHENQGLMKRMYGDVKHISVLRTEINNNDLLEIDDDMEKAATRYSRSGWKKNKYLYTSEFQNAGKNNNDVLTEPYFRPTSTSTTSASAISALESESSTPTTTTTTSSSSSSTINKNTISTTEQPLTKKLIFENSTVNISRNAPISRSSTTEFEQLINKKNNSTILTSTTLTEHNIKIVNPPNLLKNKSESATISSTLRIFSSPTKLISDTSLITPPAAFQSDNDGAGDDGNDGGSSSLLDLPTTESLHIITGDNSDTTLFNDENISEINLESIETDGNIVENNDKEIIVGKQSNNKNIRPISAVLPISSTEHMEGQLFQDVVQKEEPPQVYNTRGVNACPVKEEVVAPFWANNTRGEVLALLNLYPFEQYVHWEKCTNELKQMYCRDGCRCEQQYRLHRLLAYDPHNECRGIFSDWFRFPSCCICKCYDIPLEYRVTSRSPRSIEKHMVDVAQEEVKKAMYEHISDDWYRPMTKDEIELDYFD